MWTTEVWLRWYTIRGWERYQLTHPFMLIIKTLAKIWHFARWFYALPREQRGYIIITLYIAIMSTIAVVRVMSLPVEYDRSLYIQEAHAQEVPKTVLIKEAINWTPERISQEIDTVAARYGVSADLMRDIIECESMGSTTVQSYHIRKDGSRENSWGLVQINLDAHKDVTRDQATDPKFAIDWMGKHMKTPSMWTCYKLIR